MKLRTALLLIAGLALAMALVFLLWYASRPLTTQHQNIAEIFTRIERLDSKLNEDTIKLAQELLKHYDTLEKHHKTLANHVHQLKQVIYGKYNTRIDNAFAQMETQFADKQQHIDHFKLHNAVLRNSLSYLPILIDNITMKLSASQQHTEIIPLVERSNRLLLSYVHTHDNSLKEAITATITQLTQQEPSLETSLAASLQNMIQHIKIAVRSAKAMHASLASSTSTAAADGIHALHTAYNRYYDDTVQAAIQYRRYLNIAILFLGAYIILILFTLYRVIKARRQEQAKLQILSSVAENATDIIYITDNRGVIEYANPGFEAATGYKREEIIGSTPRLLKSGRHDEHFYQKLWDTILSGAEFRTVFMNSRKDGTLYHEDKVITPIRDDKGSIAHFVSTGRDVSESVNTQEKLDYMAHHDELTTLPNRILFNDRLEHAIARAERQLHSLALMFVDLDRFKTINDTLGHDVGDALLKVVADRLQTNVRHMDTVARLGGDEFVILLEDIKHADEVSIIAQKVVQTLSRPIDALDHVVNLTSSIGIAIYPQDGKNAETLLKNADIAMYRVKETGRNGYQFIGNNKATAAK